MSKKTIAVKDSFYPQSSLFGETIEGNEETFFGEKLIIMNCDSAMLRHSIGDGMPHRLHNIRIGLCTSGSVDTLINFEERHLGKGVLEFYSPGTLFQLNDVSTDMHTYEVIFSTSYIDDLLGGNMPPMFRLNASSHTVELTEDEQKHYLDSIRLLLSFIKAEGEQSPVARAMTITFIRYIIALYKRHHDLSSKQMSRQEAIYHEFSRLVSLSHGRQRRHKYFAEQLNVSEHYLSIAVKQSSGITAKEWIDRMVMAEIKMQLALTDNTITQIADLLDFPSDSFLSKFFRRHMGMSPLEFRRISKA